MMHRRTFLTGAAALLCAPAIVRASSLMPIRSWQDYKFQWYADGVAIPGAHEHVFVIPDQYTESLLVCKTANGETQPFRCTKLENGMYLTPEICTWASRGSLIK